MIGYQGDHISGKAFQQLLQRVGHPVSPPAAKSNPTSTNPTSTNPTSTNPTSSTPGGLGIDVSRALSPLALVSVLQAAGEDAPPEPEPEFDDVPLPDEATLDDFGEGSLDPVSDQVSETASVDDTIVVPIFGELRVSKLGLPVFSFLVGLVDGFNPCAMWVLVFLLSVLVNIKDRRKIVLIAGTFVLVSGLAYFAFMAAWLEVFLLVGIVRWIQVVLGVMAIIIGLINVKDFFAFKKGISLSIPESSKPGIYARVRRIVAAKYLTAALMGAVVLAIVVNVVELLCTAGLPALYTQVLTMHELPKWQNYLYLAIYISAYMLDDTVLLTIVVVTLSHRKLQEREGRWLKLISGLVILLLGVVMIFKPEWMKLGQ
jgi:cytochrome c biogenesis protein CcdA